MEFSQFSQMFQQYVAQLVKDHTHLFYVEVDKDQMWNLYLESFPPGTNEIYRTRREYDCSCCRHFIKSFGNVVVIENNSVKTVWDFSPNDSTFTPVVTALSNYIRLQVISGVFVTKISKFGVEKSLEQLSTGEVHAWDHFAISIPKKFVSHSAETEGTIQSQFTSAKDVFKRSLEEITEYATETVLDLIAENSLYRGEEWKGTLTEFANLQHSYNKLPANQRDNFCWSKSVSLSGAVSKIKNHSMGQLLQDITKGEEIDVAIRKYEAMVAPTNYKRPKPVFTTKMVEQAKKTIEQLGYMNSLSRRFAQLSDITINNVLWANRNAVPHMNGATSVFESLKSDVAVQPKSFEHSQSIGIEKFISDILPTSSSVEILLENGHESNLVSLITAQEDSPSMFKWDNTFSWIYNGNIADSMKQRVKAAGGKVDGVLRFSIQWNDGEYNNNDFDAHCFEPNGNHIYFSSKGREHYSSGILDVDIVNPVKDQPAVENITWSDIRKMHEGIYQFSVHCYSKRSGRTGFSAEIEYNGQIYTYTYDKELKQSENIIVAKLQFSRTNGIKFIESLPSTTSSKEVWKVKTSQFVPVSVVCFSPNYWDEQTGIGNKHYMFMLAGCENPEQPNGFLNEYLKEDLLKHKNVMEVLGSKMKVETVENQLSGLGFSSTQRNSLIIKVDNTKMFKVIF